MYCAVSFFSFQQCHVILDVIELDTNNGLVLLRHPETHQSENHRTSHKMPRQGDGSSENAIPKCANNIIHGAGEKVDSQLHLRPAVSQFANLWLATVHSCRSRRLDSAAARTRTWCRSARGGCQCWGEQGEGSRRLCMLKDARSMHLSDECGYAISKWLHKIVAPPREVQEVLIALPPLQRARAAHIVQARTSDGFSHPRRDINQS